MRPRETATVTMVQPMPSSAGVSLMEECRPSLALSSASRRICGTSPWPKLAWNCLLKVETTRLLAMLPAA